MDAKAAVFFAEGESQAYAESVDAVSAGQQ